MCVEFSLTTDCVDRLLLLSQVQAPEFRVGGAGGGLQQESSSPEQGHHQRTGRRSRERRFLMAQFLLTETELLNFLGLQLLLDCSELESRLAETLALVNTDDYGKDELATQSLITKHQVQQTL